MANVPKPDSKTLRFLEQAAESTAETTKAVQSGKIFPRKIRTFVRCTDMDKDGFLTKNDLEMLARRLSEVGNLDAVRTQQAVKQMQVAWDNILSPEAVKGKLTAEKMTESLLRRGRDMIMATASVFYSFVFSVLDFDGTGEITRKNFRLFHKVVNVQNAQITDQAFDILDEDKNGTLSLMEFVQAAVDYFVSDDENSPYNILFGPLAD